VGDPSVTAPGRGSGQVEVVEAFVQGVSVDATDAGVLLAVKNRAGD
jgi:hypothetical protein